MITQYDPDIIWFDSWLHEVPDDYKCRFLANFFNNADQNGQQVLVTYKQEDLPNDVGVLDIEKGGMADLTEQVWLTDDTISLGSWCYTQDLENQADQRGAPQLGRSRQQERAVAAQYLADG